MIAILALATASGSSAQSDWWLKGSRKGDEKNTAQNVHTGDTIVFGQYKNKPMEWTALDINQTKALLFCTQSLYRAPYNPVHSKFTTWENCTLRKKLNEFYLSKAFNQTQRERIQLVKVDNSSAQHRDLYGKIESRPDTEDYVYLLSWKEVEKYFPTEASRKKKWHWWTRSPGEHSGAALSIANDGLMTYTNGSSSNEEDIYPVLWLELN